MQGIIKCLSSDVEVIVLLSLEKRACDFTYDSNYYVKRYYTSDLPFVLFITIILSISDPTKPYLRPTILIDRSTPKIDISNA